MVQNKNDILALLRNHKSTIQQLGANRLGLFGSYARGEQDVSSDIDIIVEFRPGMKTYRNLLDLSDLLQDTLKAKVDLLTWESMASFVQNEAKKDIEYVSFAD